MCLGRTMTDAITVASTEHQSTQESQALMRDPSSFKVWLTGTELIGKATTEMRLPAAEYVFRGQSVSVEPSEPQ